MKFDGIVNFERKSARWDTNHRVTNTLALEQASTLPVYDVDTPWPCASFTGIPEGAQFFVARVRGQYFLVDTQGYDYARYIALMPTHWKPAVAVVAELIDDIAEAVDVPVGVLTAPPSDEAFDAQYPAVLDEMLAEQQAVDGVLDDNHGRDKDVYIAPSSGRNADGAFMVGAKDVPRDTHRRKKGAR